jgi:hypothetical protein
VAPDQESVKAEAILALRSALVSRDAVGAALRWCFYRAPFFSSTLFSECIRERFEKGCDVRQITCFVARIKPDQPDSALGFPVREAEAIIRAILGEVALFGEVHPGNVSYAEIGIAVLDRLFAEWQPEVGEVDRMFTRAELVMQAARELAPQTARAAEDDWFADATHESPFARLDLGPAAAAPEET